MTGQTYIVDQTSRAIDSRMKWQIRNKDLMFGTRMRSNADLESDPTASASSSSSSSLTALNAINFTLNTILHVF